MINAAATTTTHWTFPLNLTFFRLLSSLAASQPRNAGNGSWVASREAVRCWKQDQAFWTSMIEYALRTLCSTDPEADFLVSVMIDTALKLVPAL